MNRTFTIKGKVFEFSEEDVRGAAKGINSGTRDVVKYYAKVEGKLYPARQLFIEMLKRKGETMPDIITAYAVAKLRSLGFTISEA